MKKHKKHEMPDSRPTFTSIHHETVGPDMITIPRKDYDMMLAKGIKYDMVVDEVNHSTSEYGYISTQNIRAITGIHVLTVDAKKEEG